MEVTRKNFKETLPLIRESIDKADFLVIDAEFTGLMNGRDVCILDTPAEYYTTLLNGATEFLAIQYGLCAFYWDENKKHYKNETYNFYLFPRGRPGPEKLFLCQGSSLDFLSSQGFDFNKLIKDGISFMTEPTEAKLRDILIEKHKTPLDQSVITIPPENKVYIDEMCGQIREFLDKNEKNDMEVDRCNAFVRRLLYQEIKLRFKDEVYVETVILENKDRVLKVYRVTAEYNETNREMLRKQKDWEEFEEAVGFSKVARMIGQSEKLVIGHNMLLDLIHTLNQFYQPLKSMGYKAFKEFAHCMFPKLLDTKYMSSVPPFKDKVNSSVLRHLLQTLSEPPFSIPTVDSEEGRGYDSADEKHHEAGYDAYVTGLCFLAMHSYLWPSERVSQPDLRPDLLPFLNKLYLARTAHVDSPYMNLNGNDPSPSRDHVFHLTFPKEWQRTSISNLFRAFGPITVQFLDDTSALVLLTKRENAPYVLRAFDDSNSVKVTPYDQYKSLDTRTDEQQIEKLELELQRTRSILNAKILHNSKSKTSLGSRLKPPPSPEKVSRVRSNSFSLVTTTPAAASAPNRKRTSSGVFQIDEVEPPTKKEKEPEKSTNNIKIKDNKRKENNGSQIRDKRKENEVLVNAFNSGSKSKCVTAFKESDSWD